MRPEAPETRGERRPPATRADRAHEGIFREGRNGRYGRYGRLAPTLLAITAASAIVLAMACGGETTKVEQYPVAPAGTGPSTLRPVMDLAAALGAGTCRTERRVLDPADPEVTSMLGPGWARPETHGATGERFIWITTTDAVVWLDLVSLDYERFHLRCWPYRYPGSGTQSIRVTVNDHELGTVKLDHRARDYTLKLPPGVLQPGRNEVHLEPAYATAPREVDGERRDPRTLAAAVLSCSIGEPSSDSSSPPRLPEAVPGELPGAVPGDASEGSTSLDLRTPPGTVTIFRLVVPPGGRLELSHTMEGGTSLLGEVWLQPEDGPARTVLSTAACAGSPSRWSIDLGRWEGQSVRLGLTARAGKDRPGPSAAIRWIHPVLLTTAERLDGRTNVLLLILDTLRADHLGCAGGHVHTPTLDALAARGVRFEHATSHIPITGPSHSSIFTSSLPAEHGVHNNTQILDDERTTLAEVLGRRYRRTAAFVSLGVLKGKFGLAQGFDEYHDHFDLDWFKKAPEITDEVLAWLDANHQTPFFLWAHYSDPHEPYAPPGLDYPKVRALVGGREVAVLEASGRTSQIPLRLEPGTTEVRFEAIGSTPAHQIRFRSPRVLGTGLSVEPGQGFDSQDSRNLITSLPATLQVRSDRAHAVETTLAMMLLEQLDEAETRRRYALEVESLDRELARLMAHLEELGLDEHTMVVVTADHGEGLGEHDHIGHISQLYETLVHVPLIIVAPGRLPEGRLITTPVGHIDLAPTILDLLGIPAPSSFRGRSLLQMLATTGDATSFGPASSSRAPAQEETTTLDLPIISETYRPESPVDLQALRWDHYKYIVTWDQPPADAGPVSRGTRSPTARELYDLAHDPDELHNLATSQPEMTGSAHQRLLELLQQVAQEGSATGAELSDEDRDQLEALGYVH